MYGTTMKNYSNRASGLKDVKKSWFSKKTQAKENKKSKKVEDTRYLKLDSVEEVKNVNEADYETEKSAFSRKDFPIPSVIVTVLMTMMLLVVAVGLLGV